LASAGNEGNSAGSGESVGWPANYGSVVAVASTTSTDGRSSFSSTGANVEIAAPGSSILSTWKKGGYNTISGTSMACPHAAGAAAILMAENSALAPGDVRALLAATAVDLGSTGWDPQFGFGRIDVYAARGGTGDGGGDSGGGGGGDSGGGGPVDPPSGVIQVDSITYAATGRRGRDLSITVAVVDGSGAPRSGAAVLLNLQGPGGDYGTASGTTAADGTVRFRLSRATRGTYTSTVVDLSLTGYTWDPADPNNTYTGNY
jgi:subtilisin family serine protease